MKTVLLDRDGTLIADPPDERVDSPKKIKLFPDSIAALKYLADNEFKAIIITNQAGITEGLISEDQFYAINAEVMKLLAPRGITFLETYMSPHGSEEIND